MARLYATIIALLAVSSSTVHAQQQYSAAAFELTPEDRAQAVQSSTPQPAVSGAAITQELINSINSDHSLSWVGTLENKFSGWTDSEVTAILGLKPIDSSKRFGAVKQDKSQSYTGYGGEALPTQYDARQQWAERCPSLAQVMDQAGCGSCWAVSAAAVMSDRICISSNSTYTPVLSSADLLTNCGQLCGNGCQGGTLEGAWSYFQQTGVVDGGDYGAKDACYPYSFPPCSHHSGGAQSTCQERQTPPPRTTCNNGNDWLKSKWYGQQASQINGVQNMMREIYYNGPIQVGFNVYSDFLSYSKGVYTHHSGNQLGGHAVKIVGWGTTSAGVDFWTVVNSWNVDWGVGGAFAIARGTDECGIEDMAWAGEPRLS